MTEPILFASSENPIASLVPVERVTVGKRAAAQAVQIALRDPSRRTDVHHPPQNIFLPHRFFAGNFVSREKRRSGSPPFHIAVCQRFLAGVSRASTFASVSSKSGSGELQAESCRSHRIVSRNAGRYKNHNFPGVHHSVCALVLHGDPLEEAMQPAHQRRWRVGIVHPGIRYLPGFGSTNHRACFRPLIHAPKSLPPPDPHCGRSML